MSEQKRPNILFIMGDDHTSQAWSCYGSRLSPHIETPHIDRIAREGALLENCFCTNSICVPSRATILTGQYSHSHGATTLGGSLSPEQDNVAKHLKAAGYETAIVGKWHLKEEPAGFDYYKCLHGQGRYINPVLWEKGMDWHGEGEVHEGHSTDRITDFALDYLDNRWSGNAPFSLMCHFKATHGPFYWHERYADVYKDVTFPEPEDLLSDNAPRGKVFDGWPLEIHEKRLLENPETHRGPPLDVTCLDARERRRATYQKLVRDFVRTGQGIDDNIGRLLDYLDEQGLAEDTVVIYTSDQGYFLGEHNLFDKRFMLEESLRMPFVVRYPREIPAGTRVEDIITNVDFAELFLDYAAAPIPDWMEGRSFRANLRGETPADWRESMYYRYWPHSRERPSHYGVRTKDKKLIYYDGLAKEEGRDPAACWEHYDLAEDPAELANHYGEPERAEEIAELKGLLHDWREAVGDTDE